MSGTAKGELSERDWGCTGHDKRTCGVIGKEMRADL
jgi:hypothetical protein